mgnify:CR=1 FL=1
MIEVVEVIGRVGLVGVVGVGGWLGVVGVVWSCEAWWFDAVGWCGTWSGLERGGEM